MSIGVRFQTVVLLFKFPLSSVVTKAPFKLVLTMNYITLIQVKLLGLLCMTAYMLLGLSMYVHGLDITVRVMQQPIFQFVSQSLMDPISHSDTYMKLHLASYNIMDANV